MRRLTIFLVAVTFFITWAGLAAAQQQYVFPQKGQSAEQQKKDEYECHSWAVKQTGYDPTGPPRSRRHSNRQAPNRDPVSAERRGALSWARPRARLAVRREKALPSEPRREPWPAEVRADSRRNSSRPRRSSRHRLRKARSSRIISGREAPAWRGKAIP